jgi:hypothetical protein
VSESPTDDLQAEIEAERARRLDPDNRPAHAEVDNSEADLPTVEEFARREAEEAEGDDDGGSADPGERFREIEVSDEERREIEAERARRLDPDNRPANAEIDNTGDAMPDVARDGSRPD